MIVVASTVIKTVGNSAVIAAIFNALKVFSL